MADGEKVVVGGAGAAVEDYEGCGLELASVCCWEYGSIEISENFWNFGKTSGNCHRRWEMYVRRLMGVRGGPKMVYQVLQGMEAEETGKLMVP